MFKTTPAFSSYSVNDIAKAKEFYGKVLGLEVAELPEGLRFKLMGGGEVFVYPKPNHQPATFTVLNFVVDNIDQSVDELIAKGVTFEQYNNEYMKTDAKGIARMEGRAMAWFQDPAGNIIGVMHEDK